MENLSELLATLRLQKRLSQEYVAARLGLSQSQYSKMESGQKEFPLNKLVAFSAIVGIEPMKLFECLLMKTAKPDEVIRKLVHEINNRPQAELPSATAQEQEYKVLADYFEQKYFSLYREYLTRCEKLGIEPKPKNSEGGVKSS